MAASKLAKGDCAAGDKDLDHSSNDNEDRSNTADNEAAAQVSRTKPVW